MCKTLQTVLHFTKCLYKVLFSTQGALYCIHPSSCFLGRGLRENLSGIYGNVIFKGLLASVVEPRVVIQDWFLRNVQERVLMWLAWSIYRPCWGHLGHLQVNRGCSCVLHSSTQSVIRHQKKYTDQICFRFLACFVFWGSCSTSAFGCNTRDVF